MKNLKRKIRLRSQNGKKKNADSNAKKSLNRFRRKSKRKIKPLKKRFVMQNDLFELTKISCMTA
jgi:hypothetical protein